jgi:spermidine synthase
VVTGAFCLLAVAQGGLYLSGSDHVRVMWAKGRRQEHIIFERWNALSRIRVIPYADAVSGDSRVPYGWGFGHRQTEAIDQLWLDIDADASTVITRFDGSNLKPFAFLGNDVTNAAYHVRPVNTVAVIGVGGGRDVMSGLYFGVAHVTGIELNPTIFEVLTKRFADFTGNFYKRPDVSLVNAEARSWINQSHQKFGLIQISLIDTWAATAAGGLTMSENKLYTVDAWRDFLASLQPSGMLEVSRWFDPDSHKAEFYRLLSLAAETLKASGVADADVRSHILAFSVNRIVTVVVSRSPFTAAEVAQAHRTADAEGFKVIIDPITSWDNTSEVITSGRATDAFHDALPMDVTAPTDNRPLFL